MLTEQLIILEISERDFLNFSDEEKKKAIRTNYKRLSLVCHPDKNSSPEASSCFVKLKAAYDTLINSVQPQMPAYRSEINEYFICDPISIPDIAFDILLDEKIKEKKDKLMDEFWELRNEEKRKQFANYYGKFIIIAQTLEENQDSIMKFRVKHFLNSDVSIGKEIIEKWRVLMITLFAEEYLDDFQYRYAIGTGKLGPILATRKLLSPVKLIVALINSIALVLSICISSIFANSVKAISIDFYDFQNNFSLKSLISFCLKIAFLAILLYWTPISYLLFSLPVLTGILKVIACPINKIYRPLIQNGYSFMTIHLGLPLLLTGTLWALWNNLFLTSVINFIVEINNLLLVLNIAVIVVGILFPHNESFKEIYRLNNFEKLATIPLTEPISDELKEAVFTGVNTCQQSQRFFNTPPSARILRQEEYNFYQQTCSFFGYGAKFNVERDAEYAHTVKLLDHS